MRHEHNIEVAKLVHTRTACTCNTHERIAPRHPQVRAIDTALRHLFPVAWDSGIPEKVSVWLEEYERHGDPMEASRRVFDAVQPH